VVCETLGLLLLHGFVQKYIDKFKSKTCKINKKLKKTILGSENGYYEPISAPLSPILGYWL